MEINGQNILFNGHEGELYVEIKDKGKKKSQKYTDRPHLLGLETGFVSDWHGRLKKRTR